MKFRRFAVFLGFLSTMTSSFGEPRTSTQFRSEVASWMDCHPIMGDIPRTITGIETYPDAQTPGAVKVLHLKPAGTIIANGDDSLPLVAGFSEESNIDLTPGEAFTIALDSYVERAAAKPAATPVPMRTAPAATTAQQDVTIPAMVTTAWNQCPPFNNKLPYDAKIFTAGYKHRAGTSCGGIAYAQLLNYHQWPPYGEGQINWTDNVDQFHATYSTRFDKPYDWGILKDTYAWDASGKSAKAVAQLCYDVALLGKINVEASFSAMGLDIAANSMVDHMFYEHDTWVSGDAASRTAIEKSLRKRMPVPADITINKQGDGHAILFDGLLIQNGQTSYHTNYGWGGKNNIWWDANAIIDVWQCQPGIRPALVALPTKNAVTVKMGKAWELPWFIAKSRRAEANKINLYRASNRTGNYQQNCDTLPRVVQTETWKIKDGGWYANNPGGPGAILLDETFTPSASSVLTFQEKHVCGNFNGVAVEISVGKAAFRPISNIGQEVQPTWVSRSVPLGDYAGKPIRIRFSYVHHAVTEPAWYFSEDQGGGIWIDEVAVSNATIKSWKRLNGPGRLIDTSGKSCTSRHANTSALPAGTYHLHATITDTEGVEHRICPDFRVKVVKNRTRSNR